MTLRPPGTAPDGTAADARSRPDPPEYPPAPRAPEPEPTDPEPADRSGRATPTPSTVSPQEPQGPIDVVAAGVLCWRRTREGHHLEVLLVHRPAYDDWSWPKGEPERRESLAECAVREAAEESGLQVVLGRPLPRIRYQVPDGRIKEVWYWAARAIGADKATAPGVEAQEVDRTCWLPLDAAAERLTHPGDAAVLEVLRGFAEAGTLATTPTLIIRHATARPRDSWARADSERPLVASGRRQAMSLAALLLCWRPEVVLCSPARRCLQTMAPYVAATGVRLRTKAGLSEDGHRRHPAKAVRHARRLLDSSHGGAVCTHRPVLGAVLDAVRAGSTVDAAAAVPDGNPYLHPGDVLVAHVCHRPGQPPQVVAVERHGVR